MDYPLDGPVTGDFDLAAGYLEAGAAPGIFAKGCFDGTQGFAVALAAEGEGDLGVEAQCEDAVAEKGLLRAPPRMTPGPIWTQSGSRRLRMRRNSSVSARNAFPVGFSLGFFLLATVPSPTAEPDSHHPAKIFA